MTLFDGLEDALVGYSDVWMADGERVQRAVYSGEKMIEIFMQQGMTDEEAAEWISFNVDRVYVGSSTPIIFWAYEVL
jgi:hypothetical protein